MPEFAIQVFDPQTASAELWAAFHAHRRVVHAELWADVPILGDAERETAMREAEPFMERLRWVALAGQEIAGFAGAGYRKPGTPDADAHAPYLFADGAVSAESRRQGVGTAFLREVLALMHRLDKTLLTLATDVEPGHAFLARTGAVPKHTNVEARAFFKELAWAALREWEEAAAAPDLEWERYAGHVPRERLMELLPEFTALFADVPMDDLETAPIRFEIEGYDKWYETAARTGGAHHLIMLRLADGSVAGMTEAMWDARTPGVVYQQLTAVARAWRGRGLAKALKASMLRQVHESHPEAEYMCTSNGETNAVMRSVNGRAGFKPHRRFVEYQVTRDALDVWSAGRGR
jgi:GNAT superfamily N-acetyltransferase